jgi:hypothetical protein
MLLRVAGGINSKSETARAGGRALADRSSRTGPTAGRHTMAAALPNPSAIIVASSDGSAFPRKA